MDTADTNALTNSFELGAPATQAFVDKLHALPVYAHKEDILTALRNHQVVVVESTTGSGKTTQLPVILHEAGYTSKGIVGMTQPRRIAAFSTADIIRLQVLHKQPDLPRSFVEYKIRFDDPTTQNTRVKIMTDGVLLQEIKQSPYMQDYSVIIVDEAHERSLNIDFTLGLLRNLCLQRKDLKIIISSATINSQVFSDFFFDCPIVRIDAPLHHVDIHHTPPPDSPEPRKTNRRDFRSRRGREPSRKKITTSFEVTEDVLIRHVCSIAEKSINRTEGDILIFMSGEKHIKMCTEKLLALPCASTIHVLPLYGRLDKATQARVFNAAPPGKTKIVIATNIAETSITIDDIAVVIDTGRSKVNSFLHSKYASVLEELPISQASAIQRCGRAGRTRDGICYRLYSKKEFSAMEIYTQEEIHRTDLSEVLLRMAQIHIVDFENFTFISPPQKDAIHAAIKTLQSLDALDENRALTSIGSVMGDFPLSPTHARIVIEAMRHYPGVLHEVLAVISFLTTPNPFLLPLEEMNEAREAHHSFATDASDFTLYINLFQEYTRVDYYSRELFCNHYYLDVQIMEEIANVYAQLEEIVKKHGVLFDRTRARADTSDVQRQLMQVILKGLSYNVCLKDISSRSSHAYINRSAEKIFIHPGCVLFSEKQDNPPVIVAGEIVNTSKYFARSVGPCDVQWLKDTAPDIYEATRELQKKTKKRQDERFAYKNNPHSKNSSNASFRKSQGKSNTGGGRGTRRHSRKS